MSDDVLPIENNVTSFVSPLPTVTDDPAPTGAVARLKAFEDEKLGEDTPRFAGKLELGHGSLFARLSPEDQATHAKLEKLVVTEQKLADAHGALLAAEAEHEAALASVGG